jgi:hypothetical protein
MRAAEKDIIGSWLYFSGSFETSTSNPFSSSFTLQGTATVTAEILKLCSKLL